MMSGDGNNNPLCPGYQGENLFGYISNGSTEQQQFGNFPGSSSADPENYAGNDHISALNRPTMHAREEVSFALQEQFQSNNLFQDEAHRSVSSPNPTLTSGGLRLSNCGNRNNFTNSSASESMTAAAPVVLSFRDKMGIELDLQQEELNHFLRVQEENFTREIGLIKKRHIASFLNVVENGITAKLQEKDIQIAKMEQMNKELLEKLEKLSVEANSWQFWARRNDLIAKNLMNELSQAITCPEQKKEGCGESETGEQRQWKPYSLGLVKQTLCKVCRQKEVSAVVFPCRHLCLCKDCEASISTCPICQGMKNASLQVILP